MDAKLSVQQQVLSMSECERLTGRGSRDVEILASKSAGARLFLPGQRIQLPVGYALNMLILSAAMRHRVETDAMVPWLPRLRSEALLKLGEEISNWSYDGPRDNEQQFWSKLYGDREVVRHRIAPLLGCSGTSPIRQLRYHTPANIECLSNDQVHSQRRGSIPVFELDAHDLAERLRATCNGPLFTVN
jgi:hypothetical protein